MNSQEGRGEGKKGTGEGGREEGREWSKGRSKIEKMGGRSDWVVRKEDGWMVGRKKGWKKGSKDDQMQERLGEEGRSWLRDGLLWNQQ